MLFHFDKPSCQNIRKSLNKEWLQTNGLGTYSSSSIIFCNTRKYHGLFVANLQDPPGRHVLLSTLDESILGGFREFHLSCRKHPGVYYPRGHEFLESFTLDKWPVFTYHIGNCIFTREIMLVPDKDLLLIRYKLACRFNYVPPPLTLRIRPLLSFRSFHQLTFANDVANTRSELLDDGFKLQMYAGFPHLHMQVENGAPFTVEPNWCRSIEYIAEAARGFPAQEDALVPGHFNIPLQGEEPIYVSVSLKPFKEFYPQKNKTMESVWAEQEALQAKEAKTTKSVMGHLTREGEKFIVRQPDGEAAVLAGYHWFDAWGRDTFIALPGLTFAAGRAKVGIDIICRAAKNAKNGLIPNMYSPDGNHAYNSIDASLWYIWAVQQMLEFVPDSKKVVKEHCWPLIKTIIAAYAGSAVPHVHMDTKGFLHVGSPNTQLTWMDASVDGKPVTPRNGCPVEITALWYNALSFANALAREFGEPEYTRDDLAASLERNFLPRFWVTSNMGDHLADVWRPYEIDDCVRPNELFAISLPYPILTEPDKQAEVVTRATRCLLTPYGMRSLAPSSMAFHPIYEGGPRERDTAYHQGTVWTWPIGAYGEALLRTAYDTPGAVTQLLTTISPLITHHLSEAGVGSISEIFDGDPPHRPAGCIAQAWSVAEVLRILKISERAAPEAYAQWEALMQPGGI